MLLVAVGFGIYDWIVLFLECFWVLVVVCRFLGIFGFCFYWVFFRWVMVFVWFGLGIICWLFEVFFCVGLSGFGGCWVVVCWDFVVCYLLLWLEWYLGCDVLGVCFCLCVCVLLWLFWVCRGSVYLVFFDVVVFFWVFDRYGFVWLWVVWVVGLVCCVVFDNFFIVGFYVVWIFWWDLYCFFLVCWFSVKGVVVGCGQWLFLFFLVLCC